MHEATPQQQLVTGQPVLVRDRESEAWRYNLFSHKQDTRSNYVCVSGHWVYCIPYEGNEHLLGTTDAPDTPAFRIIKPCPWCGESTYIDLTRYENSNAKIAHVQCRTCHCAVESADDALDAWNDLPRREDVNLEETIAEIRAAHNHHG